MLSAYQVTREITSALPESAWSEIVHRLHAEPATFALCRRREVLAALLGRPDATDAEKWRPSAVGLTALAVLEPDAAPDAQCWLTETTTGRERLNDAYAPLFAEIGKLAPSIKGDVLIDAAAAAVALRQELTQSEAIRARIVQAAAASPPLWRLPLTCLYGMLAKDDPIITELLEAGSPRLTEAVVHMWHANETRDELRALAERTVPGLTPRAQLWLAQALRTHGAHELCALIGSHVGERQDKQTFDESALVLAAHALATETEAGLLALETGQPAARSDLAGSLQAAQSLTSGLAMRVGEAALMAGDAVSALAAFEQAKMFDVDDREASVGIAEARIALGQPADALETLARGRDESPRGQLALARAQSAAGDVELAAQTAAGVISGANSVCELERCAEILNSAGAHEKAAAALEKAVMLTSSPATLLARQSQELLASGRIQDAREAAFRAVALETDGADNCAAMARALEATDAVISPDYEQALAHWVRSIDANPDQTDYQVGLGRCALRAGEPAKTREVCSKLLETHHIDNRASSAQRATAGEVHALLAQSLLALGEHEAAGEHFQTATRLAPQSYGPWRAIASFHKERGELERARSALESGMQNIDADDKHSKGVLLTDIARLQLETEESTAAIESLRQAASLRPTDGNIHLQLGKALLAQGEYACSVEALTRAAEHLPADASIWHALGQAQQGAGDAAAALDALQRAQASGMQSKALAAQAGTLALQLNKFDLARSNLEAVANDDDAEVPTLCAYAKTLEQAQDWRAALDVYQRAIKLQPENNELIVRLGTCCLELGLSAAAIAALAPAADSSPDELPLQKTIAQAYMQAAMWEEALPALERTLRLAPDDVTALKQAAQASSNAGDAQQSIEFLHRAAALKPDDASAHAQLAQVYANEKRWIEARDAITLAIELNGRDAEFHHQLGVFLIALGENEAALGAFSQASEIDPNNASLLEALADAQSEAGQFQNAHTTFLRAAEVLQAEAHDDPDSGRARRHVNLGRAGDALVSQGQEAHAITLWQKALLEEPNDAALQKKLGEALLRQGRAEESIAAFENALGVSQGDAEAVLGAAEAAIALEEVNRAHRHIETLGQIPLHSPKLAYRLGCLCRQLDQTKAALEALRRAVALAPEQGVYRAVLALTLSERGDRAAAVEEADRALAAAPTDMTVLGHAGIVLLQSERHAEALNALKRVVDSVDTEAATHLSVAKALIRTAELRRLYSEQDAQPDHERKLVAHALEQAGQLGVSADVVQEWLARAQILVGDLRAAIPTLEAIGSQTQSAEIYFALAAAHYQAGDYLQAQQAARWVLDRHPQHLPALLQLSRIAAAQVDPGAEMSALERAAALSPEDAITHFMLGQALLSRGDYDPAKTAITRAVQLAPERATWHFSLGEVCRDGDEPDAALSHFQTAAHLAAEQRLSAQVIAKYRATLARAYAADGDDAAAREQYEAALQLDNTQSEWMLEAAQTCMHAGDSAAAIQKFEQAAQASPHGIEPLVGGLKAAMAIGDTKQAESYALNALRHDPDNSTALTALSELYAQRGDTENALVSLEHAIENTPDPRLVLLAKAQVLADSGRQMEALAVLDEGMTHLNDSDAAWALLGELRAHSGARQDSIAAYTRAKEIAPLKLEYHLRLGHLSRAEDQLDQALVHLNGAMKLQDSKKNAGAIQEELGKVFAARRQFDRAYKAFAAAIKHVPTKASLYFHAGVALKNLKDYGESIAMFRKAVQLDPKSVDAHRQLAAVSALGLISGEAPA